MRQRCLEHLLLLGTQFAEMGVDIFDCSVFAQQFGCTYRAHSLYARHIVRCIPAKGKHIDNLRRAAYFVLCAEFGRTINFLLISAFARLVLENMVFDELSVILVRCHHIDIHSFLRAAFGH